MLSSFLPNGHRPGNSTGRPSATLEEQAIESFPYGFLCAAAFWSSSGIPFWGRYSSPGCLAAGIVLDSKRAEPFWRCAIFGVSAYLGLAMRPFKIAANAHGFESVSWRSKT